MVVQHIIAKDTIDERIMKALSEKDCTQQSLINAVKANIAYFGTHSCDRQDTAEKHKEGRI